MRLKFRVFLPVSLARKVNAFALGTRLTKLVFYTILYIGGSRKAV